MRVKVSHVTPPLSHRLSTAGIESAIEGFSMKTVVWMENMPNENKIFTVGYAISLPPHTP